ncbi:MAG: thiamine phosphate synthase [Candidatus Omnitrophica bacterium]|nr:thiamine phosphate synthase [Candidatus Omnitrophota bacterium]
MQKKNALKKSDIYAILDVQTCHLRNIPKILKKLIENRIKIIQLRDKESCWEETLKTARLVKNIIKNKAIFIVNDYIDICILSNADGVHLGQEDLPLGFAKRILGKDKIIGISCHNLKEAETAQKQGADYIGLGPIFKTAVKKEKRAIGTKSISMIKNKIKIPCFMIGGIDIAQIKNLNPLKINRIAACRALCNTKNMKEKIKEMRKYLN